MRLRYKVLGALMTVGVVLAVVIAPAIRGPAQAAARPGKQRMVRPTVPRTPSVKTLRGSKRGNTRTFRLTASQFKQRIANFPIKTATVWGYNNSTPGPTLLAYRGERIRVVIDNRLPEPTTVHFHGAGAPNRYDGVAGISQPNPIGVAKRFTYAIPRRARSPETTVNVAPGEFVDIEFKATNPGNWIFHCHVPHHTSNKMMDGYNGSPVGMTRVFHYAGYRVVPKQYFSYQR